MTPTSGKAPKKEKDKKQTPEERLEAMRYNHMMYGPTENELIGTPKKIDFGASFLKHSKFQNLISAFKNGTSFKFDITADGKLFSISTDGSHISYDGKVLFYARPLNKRQDNLFLEKTTSVQHQTNEAVVHLVFAVIRSFPEIDKNQLQYMHHKYYYGNETLEFSTSEQLSNPLLGCYEHNKTHERPRK